MAAYTGAQVTATKCARAGWKFIADDPFEPGIVPAALDSIKGLLSSANWRPTT